MKDQHNQNLANLLCLKQSEKEELIQRLRGYIVAELQKDNRITNRRLEMGLDFILKSIKSKRKINETKTLLQVTKIKNTCVIQHLKKILELLDNGLGAKATVSYLKKNMHCEKISPPTIQKIINHLKKDNGKS